MGLGDVFFYHPTSETYDSPVESGLTFEDVFFETSDGVRLHGWFFPAEGRAAGTVLHLHGNAGNITAHFRFVDWLPARGWNVLCFDYRGYGRSAGRVTRQGTVTDGHAALDYLLSRCDVDRDAIVTFGQSLGGAVAIVVAADRPEIRGVVVDGAFDGYRSIARWHIRRNIVLQTTAWWFPKLMMKHDLDPIDYVDRIAPRPLLVMHGTADRIVDPGMARSLYDAAGEPKELWLVENADHYEAVCDRPEEACPKLLDFFRGCVSSTNVSGTQS